MVKTCWNSIKFGKTTSQWRFFSNVFQLVLSKDTTASRLKQRTKNWPAKKMLVQRIGRSFGNLREWHRGCNTEDGGTPWLWWWESRSPFCLGRQKIFWKWKCGTKQVGGIGSSVSMFLIFPCISSQFSRWFFATTVFLHLLMLLSRCCHYIIISMILSKDFVTLTFCLILVNPVTVWDH